MHVIIDEEEVEVILELLAKVKDKRTKPIITRLRNVSKDTKITRWFQKEAKSLEKDGEIEVDDGATVSIVEPQKEADGAYVAAWLWVYAPEKVASKSR